MTKKFSMEGYSFVEWASRNVETFKLVAAAVIGLTAFYTASFPEPWQAFAATMASLLGKMVLDALDYWLKAE